MSVAIKRKRGRPRHDEPREINDFDLALIQEFQLRPEFYDRSHPQYRNREYLEPQWTEMARNLGYSVPLIKDRMLQLRNRYNLEKRRVESLQEQYHDQEITSQWLLYDHLAFLGDHIKSRRLMSKQAKPIQAKQRAPSMSSDGDGEIDDSHVLANGNTTESARLHQGNVCTVIHKRNSECSHVNAFSTTQNRLKVRNALEMTNGVDKFKAFGQFLASSLMEMNEKDALHLVEKFTSELVKSFLEKHNSDNNEMPIGI